MILFLLIQALVYLVSLFFAPFPVVEALPFGVDSFLSDGVSYVKYLSEFFPPLSTVITATLFYIGFKLAMIVLKFFLGSRTPTNTI